MEQPIKLEVIGYDCGWGGQDYLCEDGPAVISADNLLHKLRYQGVETKWRGTLGIKFLGKHDLLNTKEKTLPLVEEGLKRLSNHIKLSIDNGYIPVVIGGDHSSAIGTWSGTVAALKTPRKFGLLWLDAHMDAHTYKTSHKGKWGGWWHAQPISALIGHGLPEFINIGGTDVKLDPQHISLIGVHSFEPEEEAFVKKHNIRVYHLEEVIQRGFKEVYLEALNRATKGTNGFGLSIDLDFFDPSEAPGVSAPEDKGMSSAEVLPVIRGIARNPMFKAMEIAEFNPHKDKNDKTRILIEKIIENVFSRPAKEVPTKS